MKDQIIFDDRYRYLDGCVKAFVRGKKPLSWILPKIRRTDAKKIKRILDSDSLDIVIQEEVFKALKIKL